MEESRDEIMIHVGMLLMLDHLDYAFRDFSGFNEQAFAGSINAT